MPTNKQALNRSLYFLFNFHFSLSIDHSRSYMLFIFVALKEANSKASEPIEVSVLVDTKPESKPQIMQDLKNQTVIEGQTVLLKAEFTGHPDMEFSWFKDEIAVIESPRVVVKEDGNWAVLEIKRSKIEDEAEYVCIAANALGGCETSCELLVDGMCLNISVFALKVVIMS